MTDDTKQACDRICDAIRELGWMVATAAFGITIAIYFHGCMVSQAIPWGGMGR